MDSVSVNRFRDNLKAFVERVVGDHTPLISAGSGIRQNDLAVVKGKDYVGYVWLKAPKAGDSWRARSGSRSTASGSP